MSWGLRRRMMRPLRCTTRCGFQGMSKDSTAWACCKFCPSERMSVLRMTSTSPPSGTNPCSPVTDSGQNRSSSLVRASALVSEPMATVHSRPPNRSGWRSMHCFR